jgi:hypothetical protein
MPKEQSIAFFLFVCLAYALPTYLAVDRGPWLLLLLILLLLLVIGVRQHSGTVITHFFHGAGACRNCRTAVGRED